jgi:NTE family protein
MLTPTDYAPPTRRRLKPSEVKYLVFEGGGGKGFAYLGALYALKDNKVLRYLNPSSSSPPTADGNQHSQIDYRYIHGIGGASAGAITALLLSIGYTPQELETLMKQKDKFLAFFDGGYNDIKNPQIQRLVPVFGGGAYKHIEDSDQEINAKKLLAQQSSLSGLEFVLLNIVGSWGLRGVLWLVKLFVDRVKTEIDKYKNVAPFDKLIANWKDFFVNYERDWGLFAGYAARQLFDQLLSARMPPDANGQPQQNIPFQAHYQYFNVELLLTGTNLVTGKTQVFSPFDTPWFPVADAVRISMGIPFVFKPVVIPSNDPLVAEHPELRGCWVDGGVLNNVPFREFDDRPGKNPKTLALRLEVEPHAPDFQSVKDFASSYVELLKFGPGEAYITAAHAFQAIVLDTTGLSLLDFAPKDDVVKAVSRAAFKSVYAYFAKDLTKPSYTSLVGQGW